MSGIFDLEDKQRLENAQKIRENIITEMTSKGMPSDKDDRSFLLSALDGMDKSIYTKAKLKVEDMSAQTQHQTASTIAELLTRIREKDIVSNINNRSQPSLSNDLKATNVVEGEMDIGIQSLNYDTFTGNK